MRWRGRGAQTGDNSLRELLGSLRLSTHTQVAGPPQCPHGRSFVPCRCWIDYAQGAINALSDRLAKASTVADNIDGLLLAVNWRQQCWDHISPASQDRFSGFVGTFLAEVVERADLPKEKTLQASREMITYLGRRLDQAQVQYGSFGGTIAFGYARLALGAISDRKEFRVVLDRVGATFGQREAEWEPLHVNLIHILVDRCMRSGYSSDWPLADGDYEQLYFELVSCLSHAQHCPSHGAPDWLAALHIDAAACCRRRGEILPLPERRRFVMRAREHLGSGFQVPRISERMREALHAEWGGLHRMPMSADTLKRLDRDAVQVTKREWFKGGDFALRNYIEALLRRGRRGDIDEALKALRDQFDPGESAEVFMDHVRLASRCVISAMDAGVMASSKHSYTTRDFVPKWYEEWSGAHDNQIPIMVKVFFCRHALERARRTHSLKEFGQASDLALQIWRQTSAENLTADERITAARTVLEASWHANQQLQHFHTHLSVDLADWAVEFAPRASPHWHLVARGAGAALCSAGLQGGDLGWARGALERGVQILTECADAMRERADWSAETDIACELALVAMDQSASDRTPARLSHLSDILARLNACAVHGRPAPSRLQMARATVLFHLGEQADAIVVQHQALSEFLNLDLLRRNREVGTIARLVFAVDRDLYPVEASRVVEFLRFSAQTPDGGVEVMMQSAAKLIDSVGVMCDIDEAISAMVPAYKQLDELVMGLSDSRHVLVNYQGLAARLSEELIKQRRSSEAAHWLEMGAAISVRGSLRFRKREEGQEISLFGSPAVYLVAGSAPGYGLVWDAGAVEIIELDGLTTEKVLEWRHRLEEMVEIASVSWNAELETLPTSLLDSVLGEMYAAVAPLIAWIETNQPELSDWVPTGILAGLPWQAALLASVTWALPTPRLHASLVARQVAWERAAQETVERATGIVAVTNPLPCTVRGVRRESLAGASREGQWLKTNAGGRAVVRHVDKNEATSAAFSEAVKGPLNVLHLGVHGSTEPTNFNESVLYFRDREGTEAETLSVNEIRRLPGASTAKLVFVGACWANRPSDVIPDEFQGLSTALIQALGAAVIAPLWPVEDSIAEEFALRFYRSWLTGGLTIEDAFADAMLGVRDIDIYGTWAAYTLTGAGKLRAFPSDPSPSVAV